MSHNLDMGKLCPLLTYCLTEGDKDTSRIYKWDYALSCPTQLKQGKIHLICD